MQDISIRPTSMKYGFYYAGATIVYSLLTFSLGLLTSIPWSMLSYVISIGVIVLAVKEYKKLNEGYMSLKQGVGIGVITMVVGGVIAGIFSYIYMTFVNKDIVSQLLESVETQFSQTEGITPEMLDMIMGIYSKIFQPGPMLIMGIIGSVFSGLILGLIIGAIMKRDRPLEDYDEIGS